MKQVTHALLIKVWTKYGEARLYGNEETDLLIY
jgi:hypothetical protein